MIYQSSTLGSGDEIRHLGQGSCRRTQLLSGALRFFRRQVPAVSDFPAGIEPRNTAALADLNDEISVEFNLGPKAGALAEQIIRLIAEQPGGLAGFLEELKEYGCGSPAVSVFGGADVPLTVRQVKKLAGTPFIKEIAKYLEIPQGFASKVLGAAIPRIAAHLTAQDTPRDFGVSVPLLFPAVALAQSRGRFRRETYASNGHILPHGIFARNAVRLRSVSIAALLIAAALLGGGALGFEISARAAHSAAAGVINGANTAAITCPLLSGFESPEITGDFAVRAGWTKNLTAEFDSYDSGNPKPIFFGNTLATTRTMKVARHGARKINSSQSARSHETVNRSIN